MGVGRNSLNVYLSFDGFLRRVFSLLRAGGLYIMYSSGLKVSVLLVQDTFRLPPGDFGGSFNIFITSTTVPQIAVLVLHPEFGTRFAPSVHDNISLLNSSSPGVWHETPFAATSVPKLVFFTLISADGRRGLFPLWDHLASIFFSPCQAIR